jgi:hypothetical protein
MTMICLPNSASVPGMVPTMFSAGTVSHVTVARSVAGAPVGPEAEVRMLRAAAPSA